MKINEIYCMDNVEGMSQLPDNFVDLTVTSPPYDNLRKYNGYSFDFEGVAKQLYRCTKTGGVVVWVVGDEVVNGSETGNSFRQALYFMKCGFRLHDTMIYHKDNPPPVGGNNRYYQGFEYMFIFSKGIPKTFNPIKVPRRNKHQDKRTERVKSFVRNRNGEFTKKRVLINQDVKKNNVWTYVVGGGNTCEYGIKHPAMFPERLAHDHILSWSNAGDLVLDPFIGSGTTAKMAKLLGRNYLGFEISQEYVDIANLRISTVSSQ